MSAILNALGDRFSEGLIITDREGRIVDISHSAELMLGWIGGDLVGSQCRRFMRCLDEDALGHYRVACSGTALDRDRSVMRRMVRTSASGRLAVGASSRRLFDNDGEYRGLLCSFSADSRDGILDRTATEFLSNVSHELRTPLSALATSIELLASSYQQMPADDVGHVLRVVHHSTQQLRNLVENLLNASSIQLGCFHVQPRPTDLRTIVEDAITFVQPLLDKKRQRLLRRMPSYLPLVVADSRRIVQVIINLLTNASKYGPSGDDLLLAISRRGRRVMISVRENGPGIAPEEQHNIFERFYRSRRNEIEGPQGVGLGLAIVKSIVTAHGGRVGVESALGAGSTFWFTLPVVCGDDRPSDGKESDYESADS